MLKLLPHKNIHPTPPFLISNSERSNNKKVCNYEAEIFDKIPPIFFLQNALSYPAQVNKLPLCVSYTRTKWVCSACRSIRSIFLQYSLRENINNRNKNFFPRRKIINWFLESNPSLASPLKHFPDGLQLRWISESSSHTSLTSVY
jgi:hypothetical protein